MCTIPVEFFRSVLSFTQLKLLFFESCRALLIFVWIDKPKPSMKTCVLISHRANGIFICSRKGCRSRNSDHFVTVRLQTQRHHADRRRDCSIASQWEECRCVRSILQLHKGLESVWAIYASTSFFLFPRLAGDFDCSDYWTVETRPDHWNENGNSFSIPTERKNEQVVVWNLSWRLRQHSSENQLDPFDRATKHLSTF